MIVTEDNIFLEVVCQTKEELFSILVDYALTAGYVNSREKALQAFLNREAEFSTGLQDGFAVPHAKDDSVIEATVLFAQLSQPVDWETFDGSGVQYVFALFAPKAEGGTVHLQMLSQLATALMEEEFKKKIKEAKDKKQLVSIIHHEMIGEEMK